MSPTRTIHLRLNRLHPAQQQVYDERRRFNVLCAGRRLGKSRFGIRLSADTALTGKPVGWYSPTYQMLAELWRETRATLAPVTTQKNEQEKRLELITGGVNSDVILASLPCALAATTVLFGKHTDKLDADAAKGIRTMPVLLGEKNARLATIGMVVMQYVLTLYLVLNGYLSWLMLVVFFAAPWAWRAIQVYRAERPAAPPPEYPPANWPLWYAALSFQHTRRFGMLFLLGLILDVIARGIGLVG